MVTALLVALIVVTAITAALVLMLLRRPTPVFDLTPLISRLDQLEKLQARSESATREESARLHTASTTTAKELRDELRSNLSTGFASVSDTQGKRLSDFAARLDSLTIANNDAASKLRQDLNTSANALKGEVTVQVQAFQEASVKSVGALGSQVSTNLKTFAEQLTTLTTAIDQRFESLRAAVDARLTQIQADNAAKLEQMRLTVDEKLQTTLNQRLGESFKLVSDRLDLVHKGLGEMQALSDGVTDLKRVMTNVKSRGTWAEWQLGNLLEDVLAPDQYTANFCAKERSREAVEFAVRFPGRSDDDEPVWLPIDSKFPREDYERLTAAAERADLIAVEEAARELEANIKKCARDIRDKYINPPRTTDYAMLFLPTEGLYAEVLRRPGLVSHLQREYRISICGPTTLAAYLNALQMGFRTLAIQKKSSEVWKVLGSVKKQFDDFGPLLTAVQKKLDEASQSLGKATAKTATISRSLDKVQGLPITEPKPLLALSVDVLPDTSAS